MKNIGTQLTDFEIALGLANHIQNPCEVNVRGQTYNIRDFYLRLTKQIIPTLNDSYAIEFLNSVVIKYN